MSKLSRTALAVALGAAFAATGASAQVSDDVIRIGFISDMSGIYRDYDGPVPDGITVVAAPTGVFTIGGRVQVNGEADLAAVHALQDQFTLTPLAVGTGGPAPAEVAGVPKPDPRVPEELRWWDQFRVALAAFPPPAAD